MARLWIVSLLLTSGLLITTSFPTEQKNSEEETQPQPQVEFGKLLPKIIDFLQEDPNRIYFYKDFLVFDVKKKEDAIDVQLQVKIICIKEEQCADTAYLICNATLPQNGNTYIFDGSVNCDPVVIKTDLSTSTNVPPVIVIEPLSSEQQKQDTIELSHEITSQISGEQFIATPQHSQHPTPSQDPTHLTVPLFCTGCVEHVNPAAEGVDELVHNALQHLLYDSKVKHELIRVVKVDRQIVSGIKYSILVEVKQVGEGCRKGDVEDDKMGDCRETSDDSLKSTKYCKINFISMPWINKNKHIISNNCTVTQTYPLLENPNRDANTDDMDNEIDVNHPYKPQENNDKKPEKPNYDKMAESGSLDEESNTDSETLMNPERLAFLESQIIMEQFTPETRTTEEVPKVQQTTVDNTQMAVDDIPSIFMMDEPGVKLSDEEEIAEDIKIAKRQSKIPGDEATPNTSKSSSSSEEQTAGQQKQSPKKDSSSSEESSEETKPQKVKRSLRSYSQQNCPHLLQESTPSNTNPSFKLSSKSESQVVEVLHQFAADKNEFGLIEDLQSFSQDQPVQLNVLVSVFKCVKRGDLEAYPRLECTPDWSEKIREDVVSVGVDDHQVSVIATFDLGTCQQTFPLLPVTYIPSSHSRKPRGVPGGLNSLPVDDENILSFVRSTLTQLDAGSAHDTKYKMLQVLEASSQVVAGALYRIKVKIAPSDCLKSKDVDPQNCGDLKEAVPIICNIKIWDRPWLPNGRETNITCTEAGKNSRPQLHHFRSKREISHDSDYQLLLNNIHQMQAKHISNRLRFTQFQVMYNRKYADVTETAKKARIFARNMAMVQRNLRSYKDDYATYGPSKFADIEPEEFKRTYLGLKSRSAHPNAIPLPKASIPKLASIPDAVDWRNEGVVTPVKNQGACGSCWAFSVTGNIEGQYAMQHKQLLEFSEQELVDCDKTDNGCGGGYMTDAYIAIEKLGGLETEEDYPYDAQDEKCHFNQSLVKVHVVNAVNISQDESEMAGWLVKNGPISIGINANAMQFYMGGVSHPWKMLCDPGNLDHGVLIVGYGVSTNSYFNKSKPFWTVKNSWGKNWGEQGYYRVYRGDGTCGVNLMASSAVVD